MGEGGGISLPYDDNLRICAYIMQISNHMCEATSACVARLPTTIRGGTAHKNWYGKLATGDGRTYGGRSE